MSESINLLRNKNLKHNDKSTVLKIKLLRYASLTILFVVSVSAMTLFFLIAFSPLPALQENEVKERETIAGFRPKMVKLAYIHDRLVHVNKFIDQRPALDNVISVINSKIPQGVIVDSFRVEATEETPTMTMLFTSKSLGDLDQALTQLTELSEKKESISDLIFMGITPDESGSQFILSLKMSII